MAADLCRCPMRDLLVVLLLATTALAGCTSEDVDSEGSTNATTNDEDAREDPLEPTGPRLLDLQDPWGDATELALGTYSFTRPFSGSCEAAFSEGPTTDYCFDVSPNAIAGIPAGSQTLHILIDRLDVDVLMDARMPSGDRTQIDLATGSDVTVEVALVPGDWTHLETSTLALTGYPDGTGRHEGDVTMTFTAIKDPDWEPTPIPDPWQDPTNHTLTPDGSMLLHDGQFTGLEFEGVAVGRQFPEGLAIDRPIPVATTHIGLAMRLDAVDGCSPGHECVIDSDYRSGGLQVFSYTSGRPDVFESPWRYEIIEVPDWGFAGSPWAEQPNLRLIPVLNACQPGLNGDTCLFNPGRSQFDVTVYVEAWSLASGEPDVDALKARAGIGS